MAFSRSTSSLLAAAVASVLLPAAAQAAPIVVASPDGRTAIRIEQDASQFTVARRAIVSESATTSARSWISGR